MDFFSPGRSAGPSSFPPLTPQEPSTSTRKTPLSAQQKARRALYVIGRVRGMSQAEAYVAAGFYAKTDRAIKANGSRLEKDPEILAEIEAMRAHIIAEAKKIAIVDQARAIQELQYLALADIGQIVDFSEGAPRIKPGNEIPEGARRAIKSVKVMRHRKTPKDPNSEVEVIEFTLYDKVKPAELLARHLGAKFPEAHEVSGPNGGPIAVQQVELTVDERRRRLTDLLGARN